MMFKKEKGQAMVEFALILIPMLILIGGIIDFGWIFYHKVIVNNAAREGARYAAIHSKDTTLEIDTQSLINGIIPLTLIKGADSISVDPNIPATGDITVTITGDVDVLTPFISMIFTDSNTGRDGIQTKITSSTIMKME